MAHCVCDGSFGGAAGARATWCNAFREMLHGTPARIGWGFVPFRGGAADRRRAPVQHRATHFAKCCTARRWESDGVSFRFVGVPPTRGASRATSCNTFREVLHAAEGGAPGCPGVTCNVPVQPYGTLSGSVARRSEEHTSEFQYLMRPPYAVFCLIKQL